MKKTMQNGDNSNSAIYSGFTKATSASAIIFAVVMLFNPNINIIDILPDFIGYFVLAKVFEPASDCAPYFHEARSSFIKLGLVSLLKIPALLIISFARSKNTMDNDIIVLFSLIFAIAEIILVVTAVNNIFTALAYLGQRSEAESIITYSMSIDDLRIFSHIFLIGKSILSFLPETLKLTRSVDNGSLSYYETGSKFYAPAITVCVILILAMGIAWLVKIVSYVKSIKKEGKFDSALLSLASESASDEYESNRKKRLIFTGFAFMSFASLLTFRLHFDNYYDINLIPSTLFGIVFALGLWFIIKNSCSAKTKIIYLISFIGYSVSSLINYILSTRFLIEYGYSALYMNANDDAVNLYNSVIIFSFVELLFLISISACFCMTLISFTKDQLAIDGDCADKRSSKYEYLKFLNKRTYVFSMLLSLTGITKFIDVCLHSEIQLIFTDPSDITMPTIIASSLPWFNIVVILSSVVFAVYAFYYFGFIRGEMEEYKKGFGQVERDQY